MNEEKHIRSISKSVIWRIAGIIVLAIIAFAYTRSWMQTSLVTVLHHGIFLVVFYLHERAWLKVKRVKSLRWHSVLKMFTYETILGNIILGVITLIVTGSWKQMTYITVTYISIKHVMYVVNEFIWKKHIRWGTYVEKEKSTGVN